MLKSIQLTDSILSHIRRDFPTVRRDQTIGEALATIRQRGVGEKIVYFYVVDEQDSLVGVLPTRRLLTAELTARVGDIMIANIVSIPRDATVLDACEMFVLHRFLALPVVDEQGRILGMVDVNLFTDEVFSMAERQRADAVFEAVGVRLAQVKDASPFKAFRFRIPWLLATIGSGTVCALLAGAFELTLARSIVLAFFLTLVLGLGESVSMQSMTVTIQTLASMRPSLVWFTRAIRRELLTSVLLGVSCGLIVATIVMVWRGTPMPAVVIGSGICLSLVAACCLGVGVPTTLHALKLDPKIAAGPITLALADICTLLFYFTLATLLLR